jgi:hypothetical protein
LLDLTAREPKVDPETLDRLSTRLADDLGAAIADDGW